MIIEQKTEKVYHKNGKLSYTETIAILSKSHAHLYENRRIADDGTEWIRVGLCGKWNEDGKQMWVINYDNNGNVMKNFTNDTWAQM